MTLVLGVTSPTEVLLGPAVDSSVPWGFQSPSPVRLEMAYCRETGLPHHEAAHLGILSHIIAIALEFDLKVFQYPAGSELKAFMRESQRAFPRQG